MKKLIFAWLLAAIVALAGLYYIFVLNKYSDIDRIFLEPPKNSEKSLTLTDKNQISSLMKSLKAGNKQEGTALINEQFEKATHKITLHYKNKTTKTIRLLLAQENSKSTYYYANDRMTLYDLPARETNKIAKIISGMEGN